MVHIGKSVVIKGELSGSEDLTIEGQVDGKIELRQNVLTIGPNGRIKAQVICELANGPTTPEADAVLHANNQFVIWGR